MKLKKCIALLLSVVSLTILFSACAKKDETNKWGIDKLVIVLGPGEDTPDVIETRNVFDKALSEWLGIPVEEYRGTDYSAAIEAMRTGHAQVAQLGPFAYIHAVERAGAECIVTTGIDGAHGYYSYIVVHVDSDIMSMDDIVGRSFGFVDPESASGNIVPSNEILNYFADSHTDLTFDDLHMNGKFFSSAVFTGNHSNSIQGVLRGDIDVAGISSSTLTREINNGNVDPEKLRILHISPLIPSSPIAVQKDLPEDLKALIKEFFLAWDDKDFWDIRTKGGRYISVEDYEYAYTRELRDKYNLSD